MGNGKLHSDAVIVVGLGRFGASAAAALHRLGHEVLAVERNPQLVQEWSGRLTHVVEADATNLQALTQLGAGQFPIAVVGIGTSIEASVLSTLNLVDLNVGQIWAKAISHSHGKILERLATGTDTDHISGEDAPTTQTAAIENAQPASSAAPEQLASLAPNAGDLANSQAQSPVITAALTAKDKAVLDLYGNSDASAHSAYRNAQLLPYLREVNTSKIL